MIGLHLERRRDHGDIGTAGGQVAAHLLRRGVEILNLGAADQLAGAAFGFVKGIIICQVVLIAFVAFPRPDFRDDIDNSAAARTLLDGTPLVLTILPGAFDKAINLFLDGANSLDGRLNSSEGS